MPNPDGSLTFEEAVAMPRSGDTGDTGGAPDGSLTFEEAMALGQPKADPVKQSTSASAAAAADNSWLSQEFKSGELFKEVVQPVAAAARATANAAGRVLSAIQPDEATRQQYVNSVSGQMTPQEEGEAATKASAMIPPHYWQAAGETLNESMVPKEALPLYWMGRYNQLAARVLNPQGPPVARAIRTALEATGGFEEKGGEAVAGMVTPFNALLAVAPEALPARLAGLANKGLALYFLKEALQATPTQIARFNAAKTTADKAGIVAETLVSYAPAAAFHGKGKAVRGGVPDQTTEPVGTSEVPDVDPGITTDEFRGHVQTRANDLASMDRELTPEETAEAKDLQEALAEGGDITALATKYHTNLSDVTPPAEGGEGAAAKPQAAAPEETPAEPVTPAPQQVTQDVARFQGKMPELMNRAAFIRALRGAREDLNAKGSLTSHDIEDITDIDSALDAADHGQTGRIDQLAREKYGVELTDEGGEPDAKQPGNAQVERTPAPLGEQEGAGGQQQAAGDSNNVVGETQGEEPGGPVSQEPTQEPVTDAGTDTGRNKNMPDWLREEMQRRGMQPGRILNDIDLNNPSIIAAIDNDPTLSHSQKEHLKETGEFLPPEEAAKARSAKAQAGVGPKLPANLEDALAGAEQSAAEGDKQGAMANITEARRLLAGSKRLSKAAREHALNRIAKTELAVKGKTPPPSTVESTTPNSITVGGRTYIQDGIDDNGLGKWRAPGSRRMLSPDLRKHYDDLLQIKKEAQQPAGEGPKPKPKKKTEPKSKAAAPAHDEAQPAPGSVMKHWDYGDGEVVGPGKKEGTTAVKFPDGRTLEFDTRVVNKYLKPKEAAPAAEGPKAEDPAAKLHADITELRDKIFEANHRLTSGVDVNGEKLSAKVKVALSRGLSKDKVALNKLLNKADKLPKPEPDTTADVENKISERESFRKALADRVKKEKFDKTQVVTPSSTGGEADVLPASSYRGLQIYKKPNSVYKPWQVLHEASGELLGHFQNQADAKAFAVRIHEGTNFDFTRPWEQVQKQIKGYGSARFKEMVSDPYAYLSDIGDRLRARSKKNGGYLNIGGNPDLQLLDSARDFGQRLYQRGMSFRDWAVTMVKHLGEHIVQHLRNIWDSVTGRNLLPGRGERGGASPGGGSLGRQGGQLRKDFLTRAEADAFIKANKAGFESHQVFEQPGTTMPVQVLYKPKAAPGSGAAQGKPVVTKAGAYVLPKYDPSAANAPPVVNAGNGGTIKPPPPGSALGPTPPGSNPHQVWWQRSMADWRKAWEWYRPAAYPSMKLEPKTVAINTHQRWIAGPANGMWKMFNKSPWYEKLQKLTDQQVIDAEHDARYKYQTLIAQGQGELQATLNAIKGNPLRDYFVHRMNEEVPEKAASSRLDVKMPGYIDGPYLPRLTDMANKALIKIGGSHEGVVTQLRRSLGHFDDSRKYESMKDGIANGVEYKNHMEAIIQRERVGEQLKATAQALDDLHKGGVIYEKKADALAYARATYAPKDVDVVKMEGFGGKDWYIRNRQEAGFIDQNLNNPGPGTQWETFTQVVNNYARNPNMWNPLPHITKNMFFKYALARINNLSLKPDSAEFKRMSQAQLADLYHSVVTMPGAQAGKISLEHSERIPEMIAGESNKWFDKVTRKGLSINSPSQKFIFEKADPYLRYKLWESYFRKGMDPQEAGNHVLFDLIRYDENSGGLNLYKQIPFNFFSTWRTGTYVTLYKAMRTHPIRTLMFVGALEYMREMIYRHTGQWTHFPTDYMANPLAEVVESSIKAKREVAMGRNPIRAYGGIAENTAAILATTAAFGPGGSQAPTTIKDVMGALQGDQVAFSRLTNMFWGLSQLFNIPQEFMAYTRDQKPEHLVNILTGAALGTHSAISYEPRRLGKYIPEWMPGMAYDPQLKNLAALRDKAEGIAIKAETTHERRYGMFRWATTGSKEDQIEQVLRRAGVIKDRQQGGPVAPRRGP